MIQLAVMVAAAENGVIGRNNSLPWHLPEDLRYFKRVTMGKPIVMGRRTFESIGRPLPGRTNIVITRNADFQADEGVKIAACLDEALSVAADIAAIDGVDELVVIGGAQIYGLALPRADRLYLTRVHAHVEGDVYLPEIQWADWAEVRRERHQAQDSASYEYSFLVYERLGGKCSA